MLKDITIKNYKLFKSFSVKDLPRILLVGGKNNCGKTSFLEAIFFVFDSQNPDMFIKSLAWRGLNTIPNDPQSILAPSFHNFLLDQSIDFDYVLTPSLKRKLSYKFIPSHGQVSAQYKNGKSTIEIPKPQSPQTNQPTHLGSIEISYHLEKNTIKNFLTLDQKGMSIERKAQAFQYNQEINATFISSVVPMLPIVKSQIYGELDKVNNTEKLLKALQIIEPKLKSLSVITIADQPTLHGDIGMGRKIPLALMGQGMDHFLSILLSISVIKNGIVLIDEIESGFHRSVLSSVWKTIATHAKANNVQVIATTHSREMIMEAADEIPKDMIDDFRYMRIDRDGDQFDPKVYDADTLEAASRMRLAIR